MDSLVHFLKRAVEDFALDKINFIMHGGEPLMQPKEEFSYLLENLTNQIPEVTWFFSIQTNATLVTKKWIDLLNKYNFNVGVSIDGPEKFNDKYRIDHYANGSNSRVVKGVSLLQTYLNSKPGCLTVINPEFDGVEVYEHLIGLGFKRMDFLLPDNTHDNLPEYNIAAYSEYLIKIFDRWIMQDDTNITIRKLKTMMLQLVGKDSLVYGFGPQVKGDLPIITIRSDGAITPTDELASTDPSTVTNINMNVCENSLKEVMNQPIFREIEEAHNVAPDKCKSCCWYKACGGGGLVGRFSQKNRFNNPSIYCGSFQEVFAHISAHLIKNGVALEKITNNLFQTKNL